MASGTGQEAVLGAIAASAATASFGAFAEDVDAAAAATGATAFALLLEAILTKVSATY